MPALAGQPATPLVTVSGQVELPRLLDLASERLGVRIDYDPKTIAGTVTVRDKAGLSAIDLWAFINEQLAAKDFTTIRTAESGGFSVVKIAAAAAATRALRLDGPDGLHRELGKTPWPGYVVVQVPPKHRKAAALVKSLQPAGAKAASGASGSGGAVSQIVDADLVVIADLRPRVEELLRLMELLDQPTETETAEYTAQNVSPSFLVTQVKELVTKRDLVSGEKAPGDILALSGRQSVLIVAPPASVANWRELLVRLDQQGKLVETRTYTPKVFPIKEVARLVEQVAKDVVGLSPSTVTPAPSGTPGTGAASTPTVNSGPDPWRMVIDDLTGSLIITTTAAQHEVVAELIRRLDSVPSDATQRVRTFPIRNRPVKEVADSLSRLVDAGAVEAVSDSANAKSDLLPTSPTTIPPPKRATQPGSKPGDHDNKLKLIVDEGMNALIAVGDPRFLSQAEELLKTLDVRQPQVMIEVMLVSLTDGQSRQLGIELEKFGSIDGSAVRLTSLFSAGAGAAGVAGTPGTGFTGSVLNAGDFNAVVRAFESINNGRSASVPQILVTNNQQATFNSTAQQPTSTVSRDATATTTTGFGGFQDAGTKISVKPQIADGDQLVLTYQIELSSFTGSPASAGLPSPRQQNNVNSVAMIPDGHAVVVGGLEFTTDTEDESRVPVIADIPLLGELFKSRSKTQNRTRFFVFIRANVMRDTGYEDLKYISGKALDQKGVDLDDDWPTVTPRVMK